MIDYDSYLLQGSDVYERPLSYGESLIYEDVEHRDNVEYIQDLFSQIDILNINPSRNYIKINSLLDEIMDFFDDVETKKMESILHNYFDVELGSSNTIYFDSSIFSFKNNEKQTLVFNFA